MFRETCAKFRDFMIKEMFSKPCHVIYPWTVTSLRYFIFVRDCNRKFPTEVFYRALQHEKKFVSDNTTKESIRLRICCLTDNYIISIVCGQRTPLFTDRFLVLTVVVCNPCASYVCLTRNFKGVSDMLTSQARLVNQNDQIRHFE
jgi:hypothetical protein